MEEYKSNSYRSKAEIANTAKESKSDVAEKKIKKVVTGKVRTKKRLNLGKFQDIYDDVIKPAVKKAVSDVVRDGIDIFLYGPDGGSRKRYSSDKISYRNYYDKDRDRRSDHNREKSKSGRFDYEDLIFGTRSEAEAVREQMDEIIEHYGFVTVADMYDMADLTAPYTATKYGWANIRNAEPVRVPDGYILKLPKCMPLE